MGGSFDGDLGEGGRYFGIFRSKGVVEGVFKEKRRELKAAGIELPKQKRKIKGIDYNT